VVFPQDIVSIRVVVFGDSRVQAGFKPTLFDELSGEATYSFNLGLPATNQFVGELRTLVRRGQAPDVVALTLPWAVEADPDGWALLSDDRAVVEAVLPFRTFFRDVTLFLLRSWSRGGPVRYYQTARAYVDRARRDRGYFFIEGMSHFPNHRLPDDFRLDGDDPSRPEPRAIAPEGPHFEELLRLREAGGFQIVFVPAYFRLGCRAPSEADPRVKEGLAARGIDVLGPDYWLYPNRHFSDPGHVNPEGADAYTRDLWELLAPVITQASRTSPPATG
jgi:hypothetical protein